jgi:hypothetical protein
MVSPESIRVVFGISNTVSKPGQDGYLVRQARALVRNSSWPLNETSTGMAKPL